MRTKNENDWRADASNLLTFRREVPIEVGMLTQPLAEQDILAAAKSLPAAPQIMSRLHTMLTDVNSGLSQIAALLRRDAALTARILSIANSPAYGVAGSIGSIEEALQRVGFGEVFRLVGLVANQGLSNQLKSYGWSAAQLSTHNLFSGLVAEAIARRVGVERRIAYTAGLLGTIGMVLLDRAGSASVYAHETYSESGHGDLLAWENNTFGYTHLQINQVVFRHWGFPDTIIAATVDDQTALGRILRLTAGIVHSAGHGLPQSSGSCGTTTEDLAANGLKMDDAKAVTDEALNAYRNLSAL